MSQSKNQVVTIWEDVECYIRRKRLVRNKAVLCGPSLFIVRDAYILLTLTWLDLLSQSSCTPLPVKRWVDTLCSQDITEVMSTFKDADSLLVQQCASGPVSYESFKQILRVQHSACGALIAPLSELIDLWFEKEEPENFFRLHTAFSYVTRLNIPDADDLQDKALEDFLATEERLSKVEPTNEEAQLIRAWFAHDFDYHLIDNFEPKHGPGGVADTLDDLVSKYKVLGSDPLTRYMDLRVGGKSTRPRPPVPFERTAEVLFVPKSVDKLRTICMEPTTLQWYQQGINEAVVSYIGRSNHHYLARRIDLQHQEKNRELAWEGSLDGSFATIDLSSASDSVSWALIKKWFHRTQVYKWLLASRSRFARYKHLVIESKKYAPMGSSLNFIIECIVFAAICEASIIEAGEDPNQSRFRVYGDDIVIETRFVPYLERRLAQNGFLLNSTKSFSSPGYLVFRESCGGEYLNGADVTPIRMSREFSGLQVSAYTPDRILGLIDAANAYNMHLPSVRRYVIKSLNRLPRGIRVRFDSSGEGALFSPTPTNFHLNAPLYHFGYQVDLLRYGRSKIARGTLEVEDEDIRLFEYLRLSAHRSRLTFPEDAVVAYVTPITKQRWVTNLPKSDAVCFQQPI